MKIVSYILDALSLELQQGKILCGSLYLWQGGEHILSYFTDLILAVRLYLDTFYPNKELMT